MFSKLAQSSIKALF
ncbi:hypothetical protein LIY48_26345 [Escherichia coli]|nr:hypothetical protein [Escherichia coli]MCB7547725.1 hypothetical protein [Escherichia coli]